MVHNTHKSRSGFPSAGAGQMFNGCPTTPCLSTSAPFSRLLLSREDAVCQLPARLAQGDGVIGWADRDREATWICGAARRLGLDTDSVSAAVAILDRVVCSTRVPPKYINCVSAACLHISKKLCEDHEETTTHFLRRLHLEYTASELKRMETRILALLQWDAQLPTISRFLDAMLSPMGAIYLVSPLRSHLEAVVCCSHVMSQFRPSVIALSIISLVLEATRRHWLQASNPLIKAFKIDVSELIRCRERVSSLWERSVVPSLSIFGLLAPDEHDLLDEEQQQQPLQVSTSGDMSYVYSTPSATPGCDVTSPPTLQTPC